MSEVTKRLRIYGEVQGVFYRGWSVDVARGLGLDGWVRNCKDGTVEMLVHGAEAAVAQLIERCWQGPPAALVTRIDLADAEEEVPAGFGQRPTL